MQLLTEEVPWETNGGPRRAGVSSFGISGTNAHVILEEAPLVPASASSDAGMVANGDERARVVGVGEDSVVPWVLSARGEAGLRGQAARLCEFVEGAPEVSALDIGCSLASRSTLEDRAVIVAGYAGEGVDKRGGLLASLRVLEADELGGAVVRGVAVGAGGGALFVFPGQGAQWEGMAVELLDCSSLFAEQMSLCEAALGEFVDWSLAGVLRGGEGVPGLDRVDVVQPVLWSVMVSLAGLWRACGVGRWRWWGILRVRSLLRVSRVVFRWWMVRGWWCRVVGRLWRCPGGVGWCRLPLALMMWRVGWSGGAGRGWYCCGEWSGCCGRVG